MVSLKDIQNSQNGEPGVAPAMATPNYGSGVLEAPAKAEYVLFKLVKRNKGRLNLDGICDNCLNPKTGKRERTWLLNGVDSIWQSELTEILKDKSYRDANRRWITFESGVTRVPLHDDRMLEFLRANANNVGKDRTRNGKYDFYEYNAAAEQEDKHKRQLLKLKMVVKASEMPIEKAKKLAFFFGITPYDELGAPKGDDGIRSELMLRADNDPENFEKYIDSEEVEVSYQVKRAILDAKIDLTAQQGNALWAGGKGFICKVPAGRKPYEYLTELAMTNSEEGRRFKEQLSTFG